MGSSKTFQYTQRQRSFARTAKAVGHPARVALIQNLAETGLLTNTEIMQITSLADGTVAQHLKELLYSGIVTELYVGNKHYYTLTSDAELAVKELQLLFCGNIKDFENGEAVAL